MPQVEADYSLTGWLGEPWLAWARRGIESWIPVAGGCRRLACGGEGLREPALIAIKLLIDLFADRGARGILDFAMGRLLVERVRLRDVHLGGIVTKHAVALSDRQ